MESDRAAEAAIFDLLARLFARELDASGVAALATEPVVEVLGKIEPDCAAELAELGQSEERLRELDAEFCRLFLLGARTAVSPSLASWLPGDDDSEGERIALAIREWRRASGLETAPGPWGKLPDEHVSSYLALRAAGLTGPASAPSEVVEECDRALLGFARAVRASSTSAVYRAGAGLLESLLG